MIKVKIASLAISLAMLAAAANAQPVVQYSQSQAYGYDTEPLYPYLPPRHTATFSKTIIVREKPIVRNTYRVIEHPPLVIQREVSEDQVADGGSQVEALPRAAPLTAPRAARFAGPRTIRAEAEITILGPDSMSIRLYRKRAGKTSMRKWQSGRQSPQPSRH